MKLLHPVTLEGYGPFTQAFTINGTLSVGSGVSRLPFRRAVTIVNVYATVTTASSGASIIFDVMKNGTTIWGTNPSNRPTIAAAANSDMSSIPDTVAVASGDYLTVDVVQVGSGTPGSNAVVVVEYY